MGPKLCKPVVDFDEAKRILRPDQRLAIQGEYFRLSESKTTRGPTIRKEIAIAWLRDRFLLSAAPIILERFFQLLDLDGNGSLDFQEFMIANCVLRYGPEQFRLRQIFNLYDLDGNGRLTKKNYTKICQATLHIDKASTSQGGSMEKILSPLLQLHVSMAFISSSTDGTGEGLTFSEWRRFAVCSISVKNLLIEMERGRDKRVIKKRFGPFSYTGVPFLSNSPSTKSSALPSYSRSSNPGSASYSAVLRGLGPGSAESKKS
ncbi:hypothetical protein AAMO2058_000973400 [Amorphochlora amoebiformis]|mmetsp:Transcript_35439/g.57159  ORF Transcript_35439/g.57159 Transcript_35439/m.57159 type:complete len:261 (-) Transcript_35439:210-992(-)